MSIKDYNGILPVGIAVVIGCVALAGCASKDTDVGLCSASRSICDIANAPCQRSIYDLTKCILDKEDAEMPPVRLINGEDYLAEQAQATEQITLKPADVYWDKALQYLGLLGEGMSSAGFRSAQKHLVPEAYYTPVTREVVIIKKSNRSLRIGMEVLAHEYTHAIQDQLYGLQKLDARYGRSSDNAVSILSLEEGDSEVTSKRVGLLLIDETPESFAWDAYFQMQLYSAISEIADSTSPYYTAAYITLPYVIGGRFVQKTWKQGGRGAVEELFQAPVTAFVDWVSNVEPSQPSLIKPLNCYPAMPPEGTALVDLDSLGVAGSIAWLSAILYDESERVMEPFDLATALVGDVIAVYASSAQSNPSDSEIAVVWRTRWSSAGAAQEVASRVQDSGLELRIRLDGQELIAAAADNQSVLQALVDPSAECVARDDLEAQVSTVTEKKRAKLVWKSGAEVFRFASKLQGF